MTCEERVFNHTAFREMWEWIARTGEIDKDRWPGWSFNEGEYRPCTNQCFACEYVAKNSLNCYDCPLEFPEGDTMAEGCLGGLYNRWVALTEIVTAMNKYFCPMSKEDKKFYGKAFRMLRETAQQIAGLPVKDGVKTI